MNVDLDLNVRAERTPNPQSVKWVTNAELLEDPPSAYFASPVASDVSPLAHALFAVDGVREVLLGRSFFTITKDRAAEWPDLAGPLVEALREFLRSAQPVLGPAWSDSREAPTDPLATRIQLFLDERVRPLVARDGGDVWLADVDGGVVQIAFEGACSGCPNSTQTLKFGIEKELREAFPEISEVVAL